MIIIMKAKANPLRSAYSPQHFYRICAPKRQKRLHQLDIVQISNVCAHSCVEEWLLHALTIELAVRHNDDRCDFRSLVSMSSHLRFWDLWSILRTITYSAWFSILYVAVQVHDIQNLNVFFCLLLLWRKTAQKRARIEGNILFIRLPRTQRPSGTNEIRSIHWMFVCSVCVCVCASNRVILFACVCVYVCVYAALVYVCNMRSMYRCYSGRLIYKNRSK